jgi:HEAT repeat protein
MHADLVADAVAGSATAVRRLARSPHAGVAAALATIMIRSTSEAIITTAGVSLSGRKKDPAAIAAMKNVLVTSRSRTRGIEFVAIALAERKEPKAITAAISAYRAMREGRARHFIAQTLANRIERDKTLRSRSDVADFMLEVARGRHEVRSDAVWALVHLANPRTTHGLIALLASRDPYQRNSAARALHRIDRADARAAVTAFAARCRDRELRAELTRRSR